MIFVHQTFRDGTPPADLAWATMFLVPKGKGYYQGIGNVEVAWKVCAAVVNFRLKNGGILHEYLHGIREWW